MPFPGNPKAPFLRRWIMWPAVRWAALMKPGGWNGWWRQSWRVLLVTVAALTFVLPPAIVILAALMAFRVVEWVVVVPLAGVDQVKKRLAKGAPRKQVVTPTCQWTVGDALRAHSPGPWGEKSDDCRKKRGKDEEARL
jgi:hypothetical protein